MKRDRPLTARQIACLRAAPIAMTVDYGDGNPHRGPRYSYEGVDGRVANGLWTRNLMAPAAQGFTGDAPLELRLTPAGRAALEAHRTAQ